MAELGASWRAQPAHAPGLADLINDACAAWPDFEPMTVAGLEHELHDPAERYEAWGDTRCPLAACFIWDPATPRDALLASVPYLRDPADEQAWTTVLRRSEEVAFERGCALEIGVREQLVDHCRRLEARGYRVVRTVLRMALDVAQTAALAAEWPAGARLIFDPAPERMAEARNRSFADHYGAVAITAESVAHDRNAPTYVRGDHTVVDVDGEVAGYLSVSLHGDDGWIESIGVIPAFRRRGLGRALAIHGTRELARRGARRLLLGVDAENRYGAPELYRRLGFTVTSRALRYRRAPVP